MKIYSKSAFNQEIINEIKNNKESWCLNIDNPKEINDQLVTLVRQYDLSEILPYFKYHDNVKVNVKKWEISAFNTVTDYALLAKITKIAKNAFDDEQQGKNADHQWKAVLAILKKAQQEGIDYCSLIRGWEGSSDGGKAAAQGDQILKILLTKTAKGKDLSQYELVIAKIIIEEADKFSTGQKSLYDIPENYKTNSNVAYAAEQHNKWYQNKDLTDSDFSDFQTLKALSTSIEDVDIELLESTQTTNTNCII